MLRMNRLPRFALLALVCCLLGVGAPLAAADVDAEGATETSATETSATETSATETAERDPILQDIIDMLEADLSEQLINEWLSAFGKKPGMPTADDMVALREAGASDQLIQRLLAAVKPPPAPPRSVESAPSQVAPTPTAPPTATPAESADDEVAVTFRLAYSPTVPEGETEWDFYVYLDGKPLSYVAPKGLLTGDTLEFELRLAPGRHVLRVTRERHWQQGDSWRHRARVAGDDMVFQLAPGAPAQVEVVFNQNLLKFHDPLSYRFAQGQTNDVQEDFGGDPDRWAEVCEEVETEIDGEPSREESRRLRTCRRWNDLWPLLQVPPRDEVRAALAKLEYKPVPKSESLF